MSFFVESSTGLRTGSTGNYPIDQTKTIDLSSFGFADGTELWPVVDAVLGKTKSGDPHVTYANNGQVGTYDVKGTTLNFSVKLIGG